MNARAERNPSRHTPIRPRLRYKPRIRGKRTLPAQTPTYRRLAVRRRQKQSRRLAVSFREECGVARVVAVAGATGADLERHFDNS